MLVLSHYNVLSFSFLVAAAKCWYTFVTVRKKRDAQPLCATWHGVLC